jgi:hypothetical protein
MNPSQQLIASHLVSGDLTPGAEIALRVDQTLSLVISPMWFAFHFGGFEAEISGERIRVLRALLPNPALILKRSRKACLTE